MIYKFFPETLAALFSLPFAAMGSDYAKKHP